MSYVHWPTYFSHEPHLSMSLVTVLHTAWNNILPLVGSFLSSCMLSSCVLFIALRPVPPPPCPLPPLHSAAVLPPFGNVIAHWERAEWFRFEPGAKSVGCSRLSLFPADADEAASVLCWGMVVPGRMLAKAVVGWWKAEEGLGLKFGLKIE